MRKFYVFFFLFICFVFIYPMTSAALEPKVKLTEKEREFIQNNPVIKLGVDPELVPFEFVDGDGEYKGITADVLAIVSKRTGIEFEVEKNISWPDAYNMVISGELDALPALGMTSERSDIFLFSKPYHHFKRVIVTTDDRKDISNMSDLKDQTVAVQRNSSHHTYLIDHTDVHLSLYDSMEGALVAVATGEEVAFMGNLASANHLIQENGLSNLHLISFEAEKNKDFTLRHIKIIQS